MTPIYYHKHFFLHCIPEKTVSILAHIGSHTRHNNISAIYQSSHNSPCLLPVTAVNKGRDVNASVNANVANETCLTVFTLCVPAILEFGWTRTSSGVVSAWLPPTSGPAGSVSAVCPRHPPSERRRDSLPDPGLTPGSPLQNHLHTQAGDD